jgi:hypothetical protein
MDAFRELQSKLFRAAYSDDRLESEAAEKIGLWSHGEPALAFTAVEALVAYFLKAHGWPADKTASYSVVDLAAMLPQKTESLPALTKVAAPSDDGTLDERAVAAKVAHPEWSDQQIADHIGCRRETLFKPNMRNYKAAKEALKAGREKYRRDM